VTTTVDKLKQSRFPYLLFTRSDDVIARAKSLAVNGVEEARGIYSFQADLPFEQVIAKLSEGGDEVGLIEVHDHQYLNARGDLARLIGHL